jgi:hypothetical protein
LYFFWLGYINLDFSAFLFFHCVISPDWVKIRLHTKNWVPRLLVSALNVCVVDGGWWVLKANLVIDFGLSQAEQ